MVWTWYNFTKDHTYVSVSGQTNGPSFQEMHDSSQCQCIPDVDYQDVPLAWKSGFWECIATKCASHRCTTTVQCTNMLKRKWAQITLLKCLNIREVIVHHRTYGFSHYQSCSLGLLIHVQSKWSFMFYKKRWQGNKYISRFAQLTIEFRCVNTLWR